MPLLRSPRLPLVHHHPHTRMATATLLPLPRYWIVGPLKDLFVDVPPAQWCAVRKAYLRGIEDAEAMRCP
jgi:hypothetical protein